MLSTTVISVIWLWLVNAQVAQDWGQREQERDEVLDREINYKRYGTSGNSVLEGLGFRIIWPHFLQKL